MAHLNLHMPASWSELTETQLRQLFRVIAADLDIPQALTLLLFRFNSIRVISRASGSRHKWLISAKEGIYSVDASDIAGAIAGLGWLVMPPGYPVRPSKLRLRKSLPADFDSVPFEHYLIADNLYQGYLATKSDDILRQLCNHLFPPRFPAVPPPPRWLMIAALYWMAALKSSLARKFPDLFRSTPPGNNLLGSSAPSLSESVNAQIRALTKGDISKEPLILKFDTIRALTELNAQAREFYDIQSKYGK